MPKSLRQFFARPAEQKSWEEEIDPCVGLESIILRRKGQTNKIMIRLGKVKQQGKVKQEAASERGVMLTPQLLCS